MLNQNNLILVSLISFIVIALLFATEFYSYLNVQIVEELFVDSTSVDSRVDIHFDVTFDKISCDFLTIDIMDIRFVFRKFFYIGRHFKIFDFLKNV